MSETGMDAQARAFLTIICREVLDIIGSNSALNGKLLEIDSLIKSWINSNNLNIADVQRIEGAYVLNKKETAPK